METDSLKAESFQLAEDIRQLVLEGICSLAYILSAKCWSLDKAFEWLDFNSEGYFTSVPW